MFRMHYPNKIRDKLIHKTISYNYRKSIVPIKVEVVTKGHLYFGIFMREYYAQMEYRQCRKINRPYSYKVRQSLAAKLMRNKKVFMVISDTHKQLRYGHPSYVDEYFDKTQHNAYMSVLMSEYRPNRPSFIIDKAYLDGVEHKVCFYDQDRYLVLYDAITDDFGHYKSYRLSLSNESNIEIANKHNCRYENEFAVDEPELYKKFLVWYNGI